MRILSRFWAALAVLVLGGSVLTTAQDAPLTVVTHDSFAVSEEVLAAFTAETGITVEIVRVGDTGSSPVLAEADIDPAFLLDPDLRVIPVDFGDVCLNYDVAYFEENALPVPQTLADLTDPQYRGLLVVQNPASSS
ncbi:MAG: ABC transporter substrate-binding protein, partial [Anaerolineae bacterium]|nr:ABC transporter substrate-binding protein [Anaerolineae bacterium]